MIVISTLNASPGGHTRTAVSTAKALRKLGKICIFLVDSNSNPSVITDACFPIVFTNKNHFGVYSNLNVDLSSLQGIEVIHSFELNDGNIELAHYSKLKKIPFLWTVCGLSPRPEHYGLKRIVSLTQEIIDYHREKNPRLLVDYMPARLDYDDYKLSDTKITSNRKEIKKYLDIDNNDFLLIRICRMHPHYCQNVIDLSNCVLELVKENLPTRFLHIGFNRCERSKRAIMSAIEEINSIAKRKVCASTEDLSLTAKDYLGLANAVAGVGRSAFEGLAKGKPTILIGSNNSVKLITRSSFFEDLHYNFSGRNLPKRNKKETIVELKKIIKSLIKEEIAEERYNCRDLTVKILHCDLAGEFYAKLYSSLDRSQNDEIRRIRYYHYAGARYVKSKLSTIKKILKIG